MKTPVLLCGSFTEHEHQAWLTALQSALPEVEWLNAKAARARADDVQVAVVANPPPGSLMGLPALQLVQSLWAGVDRLLADPTIPVHTPIVRMVDPAMTAAMVQTALWAVLALHRGFFSYGNQQRQGVWLPHAQQRADEVSVLVLGQGVMGRAVTDALGAQGYAVRGWRRDGTPLGGLLLQTQVVVNLLPLTPDTRGLLDARFFAALPQGAGIVNLARGAHVVDDDLLAALHSGHLAHAVLDVFNTEPLPAAHPYWHHPKLTVLPHAAALTDVQSASAVVAQNLRAFWSGQRVQAGVERARGY